MRIISTVTNDLLTDQRMVRICSTLAEEGHHVQLVGRVLPESQALSAQPFSMMRLRCRVNKGPFFYLEYNLRLFVYLLLNPLDAILAVDLDTLLACWCVAKLRGKPLVFDAHEYFTEVPEVTHRPLVKAIWHLVGRMCIPDAAVAYTVGPHLASQLSRAYGKEFSVVRNVPTRPKEEKQTYFAHTDAPYIFYQGALNVGRGLEQTIEAMQQVDGLRLLIAGDGDIAQLLRERVKQLGLSDKVVFLGKLPPSQLHGYTTRAWLGLNLLEPNGLSYQLSLANKFFDYIQAHVPCLCIDFVEYRAIVDQHPVAVLIPDTSPKTIVTAIQDLQQNEKAHRALRQACQHAAEEFCWEKERERLLSAWSIVFTDTR